MAGALSVRPAAAGDREGWKRLWNAWQSHMEGRVPDAAIERSWQKLTTPGSGLTCLMIFDDGEPLGFAMLSVTFFAWTGENILYLQDLFVTPEARGRGIGAALLQGVYAHADAVKAPQVFWMVDEVDAELQAFYARHAVRSPYVRYMRRDWPW